MLHITLTTITFPELRLRQRQAHQLRGYLGNLFRERSPLLHNHYADGSLRNRYPLVQYKVLEGVPTLIGIGEGSSLLAELFLQIRELQLGGECYPVYSKHIEHRKVTVGVDDQLHTYSFATPWMALSQDNYTRYQTLEEEPERKRFLERIAIGNILSFYKNIGLYLAPDQRLMAHLQEIQSLDVSFKSQRMQAFKGKLVTNALLPPAIGLGKSVSRGFGSLLPADLASGLKQPGAGRQRGQLPEVMQTNRP
jgi:hypothetical protein